MLTDLKVSSLTCKCVIYRQELNAKGDSMELNFEGFEMKYTNGSNGYSLKKGWEKWGHMSSYHVYSHSYDL